MATAYSTPALTPICADCGAIPIQFTDWEAWRKDNGPTVPSLNLERYERMGRPPLEKLLR